MDEGQQACKWVDKMKGRGWRGEMKDREKEEEAKDKESRRRPRTAGNERNEERGDDEPCGASDPTSIMKK